MASALALVLAGCSVVPQYHRPDPALPQAWSGASASAASLSKTWWRSFASPPLDVLIARSGAGNFDLQAAMARVEEARAQAEIAGAARYPSVSLTGQVARGSALSGNGSQASGLYGQASYEIDFWGKNRAQAGSAAALAQASVFDAQTVAITLEASVASTYFQILALAARLALAQQIAEGARHVLTLVEARAANGIASQLEVEQQRNAVAVFAAAVPALEQQLEQSLHQLAVLSGETPESFRTATSKLMDIVVPEVGAGLPATVLRHRPDLGAAEARLQSARFDVGAARAAFYPSFTLTAQGGVSSTSLTQWLPPVAVWNLVAGLLQPVFQGERLDGQLHFARAHYVELAASYRQTILSALQDVEDALSAVQHLRELERVDQVAVESARHASTLVRAQFDAGTADFLNVLTVERTLYQAEDTLLQVRLARLQAAVGLYRALGAGFAP